MVMYHLLTGEGQFTSLTHKFISWISLKFRLPTKTHADYVIVAIAKRESLGINITAKFRLTVNSIHYAYYVNVYCFSFEKSGYWHFSFLFALFSLPYIEHYYIFSNCNRIPWKCHCFSFVPSLLLENNILNLINWCSINSMKLSPYQFKVLRLSARIRKL